MSTLLFDDVMELSKELVKFFAALMLFHVVLGNIAVRMLFYSLSKIGVTSAPLFAGVLLPLNVGVIPSIVCGSGNG